MRISLKTSELLSLNFKITNLFLGNMRRKSKKIWMALKNKLPLSLRIATASASASASALFFPRLSLTFYLSFLFRLFSAHLSSPLFGFPLLFAFYSETTTAKKAATTKERTTTNEHKEHNQGNNIKINSQHFYHH